MLHGKVTTAYVYFCEYGPILWHASQVYGLPAGLG